jgi:large subunit ribosomal protein L25
VADGIALELQTRDIFGKKVKNLRKAGVIPVHLYGPGMTSRSLQCPGPQLLKTLAQAGRNIPIAITVEGEPDEHLAFVRELQWDPIRGDLYHVDLLRAEATQRVSAEVPVSLVGDSPGARSVGGTVGQMRYAVTVEALPLDMPQVLEADLSTMTEPNSVIRVRDIDLPGDVVLLTDPDEMVARIEVARAVEEEVEEAPEEEVKGASAESPDQQG